MLLSQWCMLHICLICFFVRTTARTHVLFVVTIFCFQAREAAFRTIKTVAECLADELIAASAADSQKSYAIRKKDELERVAKTNR